jgi:hypothetical protein
MYIVMREPLFLFTHGWKYLYISNLSPGTVYTMHFIETVLFHSFFCLWISQEQSSFVRVPEYEKQEQYSFMSVHKKSRVFCMYSFITGKVFFIHFNLYVILHWIWFVCMYCTVDIVLFPPSFCICTVVTVLLHGFSCTVYVYLRNKVPWFVFCKWKVGTVFLHVSVS